jgi:phytoene desaturase
VIIGAGVGGLSAAIRLAAAGREVIVYEKNSTPGGKMSQVVQDGFRWDTGPSVITMRPVFEALWAAAGRSLSDSLTLLPVEPLTRYFYRDGVVLDAVRDLAQMAEQIEQIEPRDVEGYLRFLAFAARLHRITSPVFIYDEPPTLRSLRKADPLDALRIDPLRTLDQTVRRHVRSPHMRMLLNRFATYVGASPYLAPATLAVIAHVELNGGVWYPQGGIYRIAEAMLALAQDLGVEVRTACGVQEILVQNGRADGVVDCDGHTQRAAAVLSNLDVTTTYSTLLPPSDKVTARRKSLVARETSCSGFVLLLGVEGESPELAHHNILFPADYRAEFRDIFGRGLPPADPTLYVAITSKSDPSHAPPGCENWFVLVNAPPTNAGFDWRSQAPAYRDHVMARLAASGFDVRDRLRSEQMLTPLDLERMSGAWRGALYGISSNKAINAFRRPHNRCPDLPGLYFAGGTTHPGGGVPMVTLSGRLAAEMILKDLSESNLTETPLSGAARRRFTSSTQKDTL